MAVSNQALSEASRTAVEVGHIFGQGGTDGLILYALILGTFLMFLMGALAIWLLLRALARKDDVCNTQSQRFAEAAKASAEASQALATSIAAKNATDVAHQTALTATLARLEGLLARLDAQR